MTQKETDRLANECFQIQNWLRWSADNATRYRNLMCANYDRCLAVVTEILNKEKHAGKGTRRLDDDVAKTWTCRKDCKECRTC